MRVAAVRIDVLALDGVLDSALGVTLDVLGAANRIALAREQPAPFRTRVVSARRTVITGSGYRVEVDAVLPVRRPDVVIALGLNTPLPGELARALGRPDVRAAIAHLARVAARDTLVCAACSGTFLCAASGVLDGRAATTSWWLAPVFRGQFPRVDLREDEMVVDAGRVVTAGAAMSHVDLALHLVRRFAGPTIAHLCTRYLVVDRRPAQSRYVALDQLAHHSERVARAETFARTALHRTLTIADLARAAATSERTLEREFRATLGIRPVAFLQRLRVERAVHLLQTTDASVEQIAERVGYRDSASLRRILRRHTRQTASALRGRRRSDA